MGSGHMDTSFETVRDRFASLNEDQKIVFLARLGIEISILARNFYSCVEVAILKAALNSINEINHKIYPNILSRVARSPDAYPDELLIRMLYDMAKQSGFPDAFEIAWNYALKVKR